jgi:glycosyltransferase involved in cell wall biosynthesis
MAGVLAPAAERIFLSTPAWRPLLKGVCPRLPPCEWLPIPSTVATASDPTTVAEIRSRLGVVPGGSLLGHFGTFGALVTDTLRVVLPEFLRREGRWQVLLLGRGSDTFAFRLKQAYPELADRIHATGGVSAHEVGAYLTACDLLVQPYPDGVCSRRTSLMAGLGLGKPIVTTWGPSTESVWEEEGLVAGVPTGQPEALLEMVIRLGGDSQARRQLGERARRGYASNFCLQHTVDTLRRLAARAPAAPTLGPPSTRYAYPTGS